MRIYGSDFRISAIFRAPGTMFSSLLMPLDTAELLYGPDSRYQAMIVQAAPRADLETLRTRLQEDPRIKNQYTVFYEDSYSQRNNQASRDITTLTAVAAALALGAITFGTFNATTLSLAEHARNIGCLRAMGFSHLSLRFFLMVRALVQGGMAYALGLAAALFYTFLHASRPISIMGLPLSYSVSLAQAAAGLFWMAILAMAGAWFSSHRLVRTVVADLLREF